MKMEKRQRGRPRKKENAIQFWQFGRAAMAMCAYEDARERGDKHGAAVRYAVDVLKQRKPGMRVSETTVKRILAAWRPRGSHTILRFERSSLSEEDLQRNRWIREQLAALQGQKGLKLPMPPDYDLARNGAKFTIRFAERPNYPRHNRKQPRE
jgi:hypothetical protein